MTRSDNIKRNMVFNMVKFATQIVLQFVVRTILIYALGAEYIGLNGLFTNIFSFLNLAELGIGSAIVFNMYKPIADGDIEKVKAYQNLYKKFYLVIISIIAIIGLVIMPFLPYLISGGTNVEINIYLLYTMYLFQTLCGYFCAHKRSLLFAYQRNDVENKIKTICILGMSVVQIIVLLLTKNYYLYYAINILFTIVESVVIYISAKKLFPEITSSSNNISKEEKSGLYKNIGALSCHKIGAISIYSTDNIVISAMLGLAVLGAYSNYYLIVSSLTAIANLILNALGASVGNMIASKDKEYVYSKFKTVNFIFSYFSAFCTICMIVIFQPFMQAWTGGGIYLLDYVTVLLLCLSFYLGRMRSGVILFKEAAGLFRQDMAKPVVEAIVNIVASIVLAHFFGLKGVVLGTIISTIVAPLWVEPKVLFKHYFKRSSKSYFMQYAIDFVVMIVVAIICYFVCNLLPSGLIGLVLKVIVCVVLSNVLLILANCWRKEFKDVLQIAKSWIRKK